MRLSVSIYESLSIYMKATVVLKGIFVVSIFASFFFCFDSSVCRLPRFDISLFQHQNKNSKYENIETKKSKFRNIEKCLQGHSEKQINETFTAIRNALYSSYQFSPSRDRTLKSGFDSATAEGGAHTPNNSLL